MALTREYELAAVRCTVKRHYLTGPERAQKHLEDTIRYWADHNMPADAEDVREAVREELARRAYTVVRRCHGKLYAVDYVSASVGLTLYVDESPDKADRMYHKLDAMTPAQMRDYIDAR